jgi:transposase
MRFVPIKSLEQQDVLSIHRVKQRLVKNCTALANEIRGLLHELGFIIPKGINKVIPGLAEILDNQILSGMSYQTFNDLKEEFLNIDKKITDLEKRLQVIASNSKECRQIMTVPGIGLITATALVASLGNASCFANGRQLSAWLG